MNSTSKSFEIKDRTMSPKFGTMDTQFNDLFVEGKNELFRVDLRANEEDDKEEILNIEDYDFLEGAKAYKICDIRDDDDDQFNNTTFPYDKIVKCLQIFEKKDKENPEERPFDNIYNFGQTQTYKLTYLDIKHYWDQVYFQMSIDLEEFTECGNLELCQNYVDMVKKVVDLNDLNSEEVLNTCMFNIFRMVTNTITIPIFDEQDFQKDFFELIKILPEKYPFFPKFLKNLSIATDTFLINMKSVYNYQHDFTITNMINGYVNTTFEAYFKIAETGLENWDKMLVRLNYAEMSNVTNLDFFFEKTKVQTLCQKDEEFEKNFERLYTTVQTIVLKSEFITEFSPVVQNLIFDCFGIIFLFSKAKKFLGLCTKVWSLVSNKISMQSILVRFADLVEKLPFDMINNKKHMRMLFLNFKFIKRFFGNPRLYSDKTIHAMNKYTLQKIFLHIHNLLQNNFHVEEQQGFAVEISTNWIAVMKEFLAVIVMNFGDFEQARGFKIYEAYLQQILHDLQKSKVYSHAQHLVIMLTDIVIEMGDILKVVE